MGLQDASQIVETGFELDQKAVIQDQLQILDASIVLCNLSIFALKMLMDSQPANSHAEMV